MFGCVFTIAKVKVYEDFSLSENVSISKWSLGSWVREHRGIYETNLEDIYINIHDWNPVEIQYNIGQ